MMKKIPGAKYLVMAAAVVGLYLFAKREATAAAKAVGEAVNPVSQDNIFNRGANAVGGAVTGRDWSVGSQLYDWFGSDETTEDAGLKGGA